MQTPIMKAAAFHKYAYFNNGDYDLNFGAVRAMQDSPDEFNDLLFLEYRIGSRVVTEWFRGTVDPGRHWRENPMNRKGTAFLAEGQHRGAFRLGRHRGKVDALVQNNDMPVYRDSDHDPWADLDPATVEVGHFGINVHPASRDHATKIGLASAGCVVPADWDAMNRILTNVKLQKAHHGSDVVSFTLYDEDSFAFAQAR